MSLRLPEPPALLWWLRVNPTTKCAHFQRGWGRRDGVRVTERLCPSALGASSRLTRNRSGQGCRAVHGVVRPRGGRGTAKRPRDRTYATEGGAGYQVKPLVTTTRQVCPTALHATPDTPRLCSRQRSCPRREAGGRPLAPTCDNLGGLRPGRGGSPGSRRQDRRQALRAVRSEVGLDAGQVRARQAASRHHRGLGPSWRGQFAYAGFPGWTLMTCPVAVLRKTQIAVARPMGANAWTSVAFSR